MIPQLDVTTLLLQNVTAQSLNSDSKGQQFGEYLFGNAIEQPLAGTADMQEQSEYSPSLIAGQLLKLGINTSEYATNSQQQNVLLLNENANNAEIYLLTDQVNSVNSGVSGSDIYEFQISADGTSLQAAFTRQLELGAIGNGVLSYLSPGQLMASENAVGKAIDASKSSNTNSHAIVNNGATFTSKISNQKVAFNAGNMALLANNAARAATSVSVKAKNVDAIQFAATPQMAELTKRSLLFTESSMQRTLWIRDYSLTSESSLQVSKRIAAFVQSQDSQINRVFLNGKILWDQKGDLR
ncbi:hypothetical protein [Agaribacter marinus]|uniref:Uncharacterized protein n=1 Tax=Agaribacter marinus TaxID=1431249 RepID=A0AA37SV76_9ALTE|nr:hypothetical protein [Agaribacter marinus]GLR70018.1 hypothetical protein GCM10007852_09260 [Agaribacter marinus]